MDITTTTLGVDVPGSSTQGIKTVHVPDLEAKLDPDGNVLGLLQDP